MSVVNKMLQDLEDRSGEENAESADYEPEQKRVKYLSFFIIGVLTVAACYFSYRALGPEYFKSTFNEVMAYVGWEADSPPKAPEKKKVSVNSALEQIMPVAPSTTTAQTAQQPKMPADAQAMLDASPQVVKKMVAKQMAAAGMPTADAQPKEPPKPLGLIGDKLPESEQAAIEEAPVPVPEAPKPSTFEVNRVAPTSEEQRLTELNKRYDDAVLANDTPDIIRYSRQILALAPERHDLRKRLAVLQYSSEQVPQAENTLRQGIEQDPQRPDFRLMLARLYYQQKRLGQAYGVLQPLSPAVEGHSEYLAFKASMAQQLEYHDDAGAIYSILTMYQPGQAKWWLGLAISMDKQGRFDAARVAYERTAELQQLSVTVDSFVKQRIAALGG